MNPIYLDHHSTTPCDPMVFARMLPYFSEVYGNASATNHAWGQTTATAVENARTETAKLIGARSDEILFTSGATESINLAVFGVARAYKERGNHVVTVATEHKAVLYAMKSLKDEGFDVTVLPVDRYGRVDPDDVRRALTEKTVLLSVMSANNEVGTLHPIDKIGKIAKERGVIFLCDAVQSVGKLPVDVDKEGIDLLPISAHKIYGPKGAGALYVRRTDPRVKIAKTIFGGGQERGLRSGTLNVPGIVGLGEVCKIALSDQPAESVRMAALRDRIKDRIFARLEEVVLNGHPTERLPNNLSLSFGYIDGSALLRSLSAIVAVSSGATCTATSVEPSHVLTAMGVAPEMATATVRFGLGRQNNEAEIDAAADVVIEHVNQLRSHSSRWKGR